MYVLQSRYYQKLSFLIHCMKFGLDLWIATGVNQLAYADQSHRLIEGVYKGSRPYHEEMP